MPEPDTGIAPSAPEGIEPNKQLVILLAALAAMLGGLPYLLFVELARFVPIVGVAAALVTARSVRGVRLPVAEEPTTGEWLLGGWSLLFWGSMASMEGLSIYGLIYWGGRLLEWSAGLMGWSLAFRPGRLALGGSALIAALFIGALAEDAKRLLEKLYPRVVGTRSPFFPLTTARWRFAVTVGVCLALGIAVASWLLDPHGLWFTAGLTGALLYSSLPLSQLGERRETTSDAKSLVDTIEHLLTAAGYRTTRAPVTGNAEVDPLLAQVDYLAESRERAYAVEVKVLAQADQSVGWTSASNLRTAARVLEATLQSAEGVIVPVEPLIVIVGGRTNEELRHFADEQGVRLAHIGSPESLKEAAGLSDSDLRQQALQLLGIPPGGEQLRPAATAG